MPITEKAKTDQRIPTAVLYLHDLQQIHSLLAAHFPEISYTHERFVGHTPDDLVELREILHADYLTELQISAYHEGKSISLSVGELGAGWLSRHGPLEILTLQLDLLRIFERRKAGWLRHTLSAHWPYYLSVVPALLMVLSFVATPKLLTAPSAIDYVLFLCGGALLTILIAWFLKKTLYGPRIYLSLKKDQKNFWTVERFWDLAKILGGAVAGSAVTHIFYLLKLP